MPEPVDAPPLPPHRIGVLIVEDEPLLRMDLIDRLKEAGLAVFEARAAEEALAILEARGDVRVVITDVDLDVGRLSGLDLARIVAGRWPQIGIVVTSGRARPGLDELPEGSRFLPKPCSTRDLTGSVFGFIERQGEPEV